MYPAFAISKRCSLSSSAVLSYQHRETGLETAERLAVSWTDMLWRNIFVVPDFKRMVSPRDAWKA
jgi:hypothetical protein